MKIALVTTTINVPHVLALYRKLDPAIEMFVAGDLKSPHEAINALCARLGNARYLHPDEQKKWKCSELIGFSNIQRRNIATLEALAWGADVIYSCDDDNIALDRAHFINLMHAFEDFHGPCVSSPGGWFDPGQWQFPRDDIDPVVQRGFPQHRMSYDKLIPAVGAKVGVVQGICLGDPDTSAVDRISRHPVVHTVSELYQRGVVVAPNTRTVFNSQNTAFIRELAPAMFMLPGVGRYDDIYASLICQRVMRERGLHVHFGKPFVWQQRNEHYLIDDLRNEIEGMANVVQFAQVLDDVTLQSRPVIEQTGILIRALAQYPLMPVQASTAALAWLVDCEQVLG